MGFMDLFKTKNKIIEKEENKEEIEKEVIGETEVILLKETADLEIIPKEKDISKKFLVHWKYDKDIKSLIISPPENIRLNKEQNKNIYEHILKVALSGIKYSQFSLGKSSLKSPFFKKLIEKYPEYSKMEKGELKKEFERIDKERRDFIKKMVPKQGIKYNANSKEYKEMGEKYCDLNDRLILLSELRG